MGNFCSVIVGHFLNGFTALLLSSREKAPCRKGLVIEEAKEWESTWDVGVWQIAACSLCLMQLRIAGSWCAAEIGARV